MGSTGDDSGNNKDDNTVGSSGDSEGDSDESDNDASEEPERGSQLDDRPAFLNEDVDTAWVSDITEFRVAGRKVYLSPIMDLYDRTILAHELSLSPTTALTAKSLQDAISWHTPGEGLIVHTDQGFQYQHSSWKKLIEGIDGVQSMSRKGNCYDNAVMENFFDHLKSEMFHGETFSSIEEFCKAVDDYIFWYNNTRLQQRIKDLAPMHYRNQALDPLTA